MPQTKPLPWIKFLIVMNLILMFMTMKTFQMINKKTKKKLSKKTMSIPMKW